jgi:hypothetical protein
VTAVTGAASVYLDRFLTLGEELPCLASPRSSIT